MAEHRDIVIVGGGHAGAQTAIALRQGGFAGTVAILGEEPELPYERPALTKDYLAGEKSAERLQLRPVQFWRDRAVEFRLGRRVIAVDSGSRRVVAADGAVVSYQRLVWAAGGAARRLGRPGEDLDGVHSIRSRADVDRILARLGEVERVVIVGGGYVGLETAAVLTKRGKRVTLVEAQSRLLARVAGEPLSRYFEAAHRARGVDLRLGAEVRAIEGTAGRVSGVRLGGGEVLRCEMVVIGIGIEPCVGPLRAAGAAGEDGVDIDGHCRTSLADVYAVGDCAAHANAFTAGRRVRLESIQNANDQAVVAARSIMGQEQGPYRATPWFWSNQFDIRLQTVGLSQEHDGVVVRGEPAEGTFSVIYLREGRVIALDCVNRTSDFVQGRALVERGVHLRESDLADCATSLATLMKSAAA